jgi:hypothetical protein
MAKLKPVERIINITIPSGQSVVDTAQCLSLQNRMAFRQGMEYGYDGIEIFSLNPDASGLVQVYRLPNTWVTANAWVKAFAAWRRQRAETLDESMGGTTVARYADFKVYYNSGHQQGTIYGGTVNQVIPNAFMSLSEAQVIDPGAAVEWEYSTMVVPNVAGAGGVTEEYNVHLIGDDSGTGKSLIKAYAESRARPFPVDPSTVEGSASTSNPGGLYAEMFDVGEDNIEIVETIRDENESPPYIVGGVDSAEEFYPWGMQSQNSNSGSLLGNLQDYLIVRSGSTIATDATGPFTALCGLLWFSNGSGESIQAKIKVSLGNYKGVAARSMMEVN